MAVIAEFDVCTDCFIAAVNDDYSGLDYHYSEPESTRREKLIRAGLAELGDVVPDDRHDEFSSVSCDCCGTRLAGERHGLAKLG